MKGLWNGNKEALNDGGNTLTSNREVLMRAGYVFKGHEKVSKKGQQRSISWWRRDVKGQRKGVKGKEKLLKLMEMYKRVIERL